MCYILLILFIISYLYDFIWFFINKNAGASPGTVMTTENVKDSGNFLVNLFSPLFFDNSRQQMLAGNSHIHGPGAGDIDGRVGTKTDTNQQGGRKAMNKRASHHKQRHHSKQGGA